MRKSRHGRSSIRRFSTLTLRNLPPLLSGRHASAGHRTATSPGGDERRRHAESPVQPAVAPINAGAYPHFHHAPHAARSNHRPADVVSTNSAMPPAIRTGCSGRLRSRRSATSKAAASGLKPATTSHLMSDALLRAVYAAAGKGEPPNANDRDPPEIPNRLRSS